MANLMSTPDTLEVAEMRRNDTRYRLRRWNAYVAARMDGNPQDFHSFAADYDSGSDALTLDDPL